MFQKQLRKNDEITLNSELSLEEFKLNMRIKELEIETLKKELKLKDQILDSLENRSKDSLIKDKKFLEEEVKNLKFKIDNDISKIELETQCKKAESKNEILESEIKYLKELLSTYQEMPDLKRMISSLSSLSVPNMEELSHFASVINNTQISDLIITLRENIEALEKFKYCMSPVARSI